ncbi:hypothetical protein KBD34_04800 [Patescibacteria group bacterium]|nr:hypothetical protein [Patescibacteria group bacterium]
MRSIHNAFFAIVLMTAAACGSVDDPQAPTGTHSASVELVLLRHPEIADSRAFFYANIAPASGGTYCAILERSLQGALPERTYRCTNPFTWPHGSNEGLIITGELEYRPAPPTTDFRYNLCRRQLAVDRGEMGASVPFRLIVRDSATGLTIPTVPVESGGRCVFELRPPPGS